MFIVQKLLELRTARDLDPSDKEVQNRCYEKLEV